MVQGIRKGKVSGYAPYKSALGSNTLRFIELDEDLSLRDYGIELQQRTTEQEKNWIFSMVQADISAGFLDTSDAIAIVETSNAKQAMSLIAYRVKKQKAQIQQNQLQQIQLNNKGQADSAMLASKLTQAQKNDEFAHIQAMAKIESDKEVAMLMEKLASQERIALHQDQTKLQVADTTGTAKILSNEITGQHQQAKQMLANQKETADVD